ncbi:MAG TPA: D-alanine--D-alanine ligase family protein [Candidatus Polarisedimenticolia bacterium]|nr:D-alanine--D-alanine ligase family protein [Candidatus Polarisedimenticolia bacterium]
MRVRRRGKRLRVGVIFGGRSVEHEISLVSARAVMDALDPARYEVVPIGIGKSGRWVTSGVHAALPADPSVKGLVALRNGSRSPAARRRQGSSRGPALDVIFPVVHGTGGEDGALQGLLDLADIPYVGAGVLGSALGMDKALMKTVFRQCGLPIVDYRVVLRRDLECEPERTLRALEEAFRYPCFVKPSNGGSSVGVTKAKEREGLLRGLRLAARYDRKIIVERGIDAREIECSVLGNDDPEASVPGEIIPVNEFYDYRAKYLDPGSRLEIPARLAPGQERIVRDIAVRAFRALDLAGMARVDFFLDRQTEAIFLNEVNTIPGFTPISMYPKLWEASGLPFPRLVDRLIELALERHEQRAVLVTSYDPTRNGSGGRR